MRFLSMSGRSAGLALSFVALLALPGAATGSPADTRSRTLLDSDWRFHAGEANGAEAPGFNDRSWEAVHLPHDYVREGTIRAPASTKAPSTAEERAERNHGYLPHETPGWYRRHLVVPPAAGGRILRLDFDGAYRESDVWLNGQLLGHHRSGYTPFSYDITKLVRPGDNVITVRVDPRENEGWWYEGGGIYRHVWLTTLAPTHVAQWGTYVIATVPNGDAGAADEADLTLQTTVESAVAAQCDVLSEIISPDGNSVAKIRTTAVAVGPGQPDVTQRIKIPRPQLWSLESPRQYELRTTVFANGQAVDATTTAFGIRTLRFDPKRGFFLNGKHVEIYGLCCHQDFGGIGIAVPDNLQAWRVEQLKKAGANGWRTAHNPPSEALLDACDRLGMLVMDENRHLGDAFTAKSPEGTPASDLSDLATMIRRDRNHPSIIMWSMCNEEGALHGKPEGAAIFKQMMGVVHRYDRTRPITSAMNGGWLAAEGIADVEDIIGVNYNINKYDAIHERHPDKMMFGSECTNEKTTRGEYADNRAAGMSSQYNLSDKGWQAITRRPFMAGSYTWTGFDYKGEPNPYGWPAVSNNTGLFDLCGFPKDRFYYFQSCWTEKPMVHVVPSAWNGPVTPGEPVRVVAFTNARNVELFLNGQSLGRRDVERDAVAEWTVPFAPGQLVAKAYAGTNVVATDTVETTGAPARLQVTLDTTPLKPNGEDVVVAQVSIVDDKGRVVPNAANRVTFRLTGPGRIFGVANGNPADHDPDTTDQRNAFHGHVAAIVRAATEPGTLQLTASSAGLTSGNVTINVR